MKRADCQYRKRNRRLRRLPILLIVISSSLVVAIAIRVSQARACMEAQDDLVEGEGKGIYKLSGYRFIEFSERKHSGSFVLSITVIAEETGSQSEGDESRRGHRIEIDYPWIPLLGNPTHRI